MFLGWEFWISTWQTYGNDEFGFSFRYPSKWFITESNPVTKAQVDKYNMTSFYIDSIENLPNHSYSGPIRSPGDVQVNIEKNNSILESRRQQGYKLLLRKFGTKIGYVDEGFGRTTVDLESRFVLSKEFFVSTEGVNFFVNTETLSDNSGIFSELKARFYHWIGSTILDSFIFTK